LNQVDGGTLLFKLNILEEMNDFVPFRLGN
jgi:hypothetical protein